MDFQEATDRLYAASLDEFTETRDRLVKQLRAADQSDAMELSRQRKPTVPAWVVNQVARRDPDGIEILLERGNELRRTHHRLLSGAGDRQDLAGAASSATTSSTASWWQPVTYWTRKDGPAVTSMM